MCKVCASARSWDFWPNTFWIKHKVAHVDKFVSCIKKILLEIEEVSLVILFTEGVVLGSQFLKSNNSTKIKIHPRAFLIGSGEAVWRKNLSSKTFGDCLIKGTVAWDFQATQRLDLALKNLQFLILNSQKSFKTENI